MQITSPAFQNNQKIPAQYTCDGDPPAGGVNPPLKISDIPAGAKSLALVMDDPDSPTGTWDHWIVFNISVTTAEISEDSEPAGIQGKTSFGERGYGGPCPGRGEHRYFFKLYALDTQLNLQEGASKAEVEQATAGHILDQAELMGRYQRLPKSF